MKVYVLNVKTDTERLKAFVDSYPSCLPSFEVWEAKTGADVEKPNWWCSSANRWSLVQNFIDILSQDTDEDILIFEDDCTFADDFETKYNDFLEEVPDDWDMLYLGAQHITAPIQVSDNILKLVNSVCGHAIIYKNSILKDLVSWYQQPNWGCKHMPDMRRAQAMAKGTFKCYSPLVNICGQARGYSKLMKRNREARWYSSFSYISKEGFISAMSGGKQVKNLPTIDPIPDLIGKDICSVGVYGKSIFYALTFLLKQQELKQKIGLPIVCHVDTYNNELIHKIALQENIDISGIYFIVHTPDTVAASLLWRYTPVGAAITHVFDVDNKLHQAHIDAINDFKENGNDFSIYSCKYVRSSMPVLGGAMGIKESELVSLFDFMSRHSEYMWGADEYIISEYLTHFKIPCLVYTTNGCRHKSPEGWSVKPINMNIDRLHYDTDDFNKLAYYSDGIYHIDDKEYPVEKYRVSINS